MNEQSPIIDVTPVTSSSERLHADAAASSSAQTHQAPSASGYQASSYQASSYQASSYRQPGFGTTVHTYSWSTGQSAAAAQTSKGPGLFGGLVRIAFGILLVLIGIPLLILPGPGLLAIIAGIALTGSGLRALMRPLRI